MPNRVLFVLIALSMMINGCGPSGVVNALGLASATPSVAPPPTVMPMLSTTNVQTDTTRFGVSLTPDPHPSTATIFRPAFDGPGTPIPNEPPPTVGVAATSTAAPTRPPAEYIEVVVYGDKVDPNWSLEQSSNMAYDQFDALYWFSVLDGRLGIDSGAVSLSVTPLADYGTLFFTVRPDTRVTYEREKVIGISLWLNSGSAILDTDDLSLTVVGSNNLSYWSPDDYSVFPESDNSFSETRLYYLGLNRAIPPDTWAQVILWLDDLQFDPLYSNVTGFYIKNDVDFDTTFYVDNVSLLMMP